MKNQNNDWINDSDSEFLSQLKNANIRSSNSRRFKKILFLAIISIVICLSIAIPVTIYSINKPFSIVVETNINGNLEYNIKIEKGTRIGNIKPVQIEGYDFLGWYKDESFLTSFQHDEKVNKNTKLFAFYKIKQFQVELPLNEAFIVEIISSSSQVEWNSDFIFAIYPIDQTYDISSMEILVNGKVLKPEIDGTYRITNIKEDIEVSVDGSISRNIDLVLNVDGVEYQYKVKDNTNLQRAFVALNCSFTEYNTMGWFLDKNLTMPANLTERLTSNTTVYTKSVISLSSLEWKWIETTLSWGVDLSDCSQEIVVLPSKYIKNNKDGIVTEVTGSFGVSNSKIKQIYLPSTINLIDKNAFYGYSNLEKITIPTGLKNIGNSAFQNCSSLTDIIIPNNVTNISNYTFANCSSLKSFTIPNSILSIGYYAFDSCVEMENLYFENDSRLTNLGGMAFGNCESLKTISIPNSVTIIGYQNFYNCKNLETVNLPEGLEIISDYAFYNCEKLTNISIPNIVQVIGSYAFYNCAKLHFTTLPTSLTKIDTYTFKGCDALTNLTIPENVTIIEDYAFYRCSKLTQIDLNNKITKIGNYAFAYCSMLNNLNLPNTLTTFGNSVFSCCYAITEITLPSSLKTWSTYIFNLCSALKRVKFEEGIAITSIPSGTFYGCTVLNEISLPSTITKIDSNVFYNCKNLTSISLPNNLSSIGSSAFEKCSNLSEVLNINIKLKTISEYAFSECSSLQSFTILSSLTSFGSHVFTGCVSLENVTIENASIYSKIKDLYSPGYLISYAKNISVLKTIVDAGVDNYLTQNYSKTISGNGEYYLFQN